MVFRVVTWILTVIIGAVPALCARCAKTPPHIQISFHVTPLRESVVCVLGNAANRTLDWPCGAQGIVCGIEGPIVFWSRCCCTWSLGVPSFFGLRFRFASDVHRPQLFYTHTHTFFNPATVACAKGRGSQRTLAHPTCQ